MGSHVCFDELETGDSHRVCLAWFVNIQTLSLYVYVVDEGVATRAPVPWDAEQGNNAQSGTQEEE